MEPSRSVGWGATVRVNVTFPASEAPIPSVNAHPIVTVSPDGQRFVYVGGEPDKARLYLREMNRFDADPLEGTEGAHGPFFSPDGDWVAFFAQGTLKKLRITGNQRATPQVLCATDTGVGGAWVSATEIVFAPNWRGSLMRVQRQEENPFPSPCLPARRIAGPTGSTMRRSSPPGGDRRLMMRLSWPSRWRLASSGSLPRRRRSAAPHRAVTSCSCARAISMPCGWPPPAISHKARPFTSCPPS